MKHPKNQVDKLKKVRLWPAVLLLVLAAALGVALLCAEVSLYVSYVVETKCLHADADTSGLVRALRGADDPQAAVEAMEPELIWLDAGGAVRAANCAVTADLACPLTLDLWEPQEIFPDAGSPMTARALATGQADPFDLLAATRMQAGSISRALARDRTEPLARCSYWQSEPLGQGERLLIRRTLEFRRDDLQFGAAVVLVSAFTLLLILGLQVASLLSRVRARRRVEKLLLLDPVTGGRNFTAFLQQAVQMLSRRGGRGRAYAAVRVHLVKYPGYCSLYGARAGEALLLRLDAALSAALDRRELSCHIADGDFALLLHCPEGQEAAVARVERLLSSLGGLGATVQAGICFLPPEAHAGAAELEALCANAGVAVASLAQDEANTVACFSREMRDEQLWQDQVERTMEAALQNEEFRVYIQPKYAPVSGTLQGGEALVRWFRPGEGMIAPWRFIPIFERTGFIAKLDDYMISHVAQLQRGWMEEGRAIVPVSVNVSRAHFAQPDLAEHIRRLVDAHGVPHDCIEIELTESAFFDDKKTLLATVRQLRADGFLVSMDDFGSGYSSLNSLKDLPLDVLKLDAEFFRGEDFGERGEIVVGKAIALAKQLDMRIVAEGVEKQEQVDFLASQGCDMIQGYFYAKPMPAAQYAARLPMQNS